MKHILVQNVKVLDSIILLLSDIDNSKYKRKCKVIFGGTVGQHFRHIIEFYQSILYRENNEICYDNRKRDQSLETIAGYATQEIEKLIHKLCFLEKDEGIILNGNFSEDDINASQQIRTSLERELAYALDHTVHHLAICKIAFNEMGIQVPNDLGVAPSTLRQRNLVCAP